jgi:hypothetical protein
MANLTLRAPPERKVIKVGANKYVSESICQTDPQECIDTSAVNKTIPVVVAPIYKRTIQQCSEARAKDWEVYCQVLHSQGFEIDCVNANVASKEEILDNLMEGAQSAQMKCLMGN